ncbi:glycosyltransferase [Luteimonas sp. M1R5S18]|uniref:Glycosyltransferase n=1 Tax=Luteimonas rhizosphaericola TaxID=3042024 RepID=A0ABT6JKZ8_9GAMM|nr:glycosyltransferase [Luteimonas rhizosphaericola]MDH5831207.1 glycosyltransferase [Luteimonas rhizosphaericola]
MIGVLVPAHDEQALIGGCLESLRAAAGCPRLGGEPVRVVVALDRCRDATARICAEAGVATVCLDACNVGRARAAAAEVLLQAGARWLASTDADSRVPRDWLSGQVACGADAFCGTVRVGDWLDYGAAVRDAFLAREQHRDDHPHVHGANLGVSAAAYRAVGGFAPMPAHEDHALVRALAAGGWSIARRNSPAVTTSARRDARAPQGFGEHLLSLEHALA